MRRLLLTLTAVLATAALARPADAQLKFGVQGAVLTEVDDLTDIDPDAPDLSGTFGLGARGALQPPLLPIGLVGQGVYYFVDCVGDCSYLTYSLAAQVRMTGPMVSPYAIAGWQWRRSSNGTTETENGAMLGIGAQLNVAVAAFLELTFEFHDEVSAPSVSDFDNNPIVIKVGILFG
jgi:hypothetical protein